MKHVSHFYSGNAFFVFFFISNKTSFQLDDLPRRISGDCLFYQTCYKFTNDWGKTVGKTAENVRNTVGFYENRFYCFIAICLAPYDSSI